MSWIKTYVWVMSGHVVFTFCALVSVLYFFSGVRLNPLFLCFLALGLMVVAPLGLPGIDDRIYNFYVKTRTTALWRNTTHTAVQAYYILAFGLCCHVLQSCLNNKPVPRNILWASLIFLCFSALIKPSFAAVFIPALGLLFLALYLGRRVQIRQAIYIGTIVIPTCLTLVLQYHLGFVSNAAGPVNSYIIDPLTVWRENNISPLLSLILWLVFPLYVTYHRIQTLGIPCILGWISLEIALIPYILLRETSSFGDRNFEWFYLHAMHVLFIGATIEWLRWKNENNQQSNSIIGLRHTTIAGFLLVGHIIFGFARLINSIHYLQ
jgi:hypothetical protein